MATGKFFGEDVFNGDTKLVKIQAAVKVETGSQLIQVGLDFATNSIIPGMPIAGPGIPANTVVLEVVNGIVLMSNAATESYLSKTVTLIADDTTGLGIGSMIIGTSFIVA